MKSTCLFSFALLILCCAPVPASVFMLPDNGDNVVGNIQYRVVKENETLLDIARQFNVGYNEIVAANPGINPWMPKKNYRAVIPSQYVLPPKPWRGIVVNLPEMRLYYFPPLSRFSDRRVITMPLSIGKINWQTPTGAFRVTDKIKHPSWTVPQSIVDEFGLERYGNRRIVPPRDDSNPLGDYAILLNEPGYLVHGTNKPFSIGRRVSHGCLRLYPEDIEVLFDYAERDMPVRIINLPVKVGKRQHRIYVETHANLQEDVTSHGVNITPVVRQIIGQIKGYQVPESAWRHLEKIITQANGLPVFFLKLNDARLSRK